MQVSGQLEARQRERDRERERERERSDVTSSVTRKKSPNVYKSCLKMISQVKLNILTPLQKLPKNVRDLGKLVVAKALKSCPKY